ncbi:MAG TPA: hypothetical protein VFS15_19970 [Kofleriaceae bacterium]|nr:hypothetical protein [Kofleriaceae bacterium]
MKRFAWLLALTACGHDASHGGPDAAGGGDGSGSGSADAMVDAGDPDAAVMPPSGFDFEGSELTVCDGSFHAPTLVAAEDRFVVGCMPSGSQNVIPQVKFLTQAGAPLGEVSLLTSDGYYYKESRLSHHDGKFQVVYEYNCDDNGSWLVGWGWGCIELRELDDTGDQIIALQFGETGHNGHPVLDGHDSELGVGWVSYDDAYFRRLGADRELVGGRGANLLLGPDPLQSDARSAARTQIAWDGDGYGVFTIIGTKMYFSRVEMDDNVPVAMKDLGTAFSQTFSGEFSAVSVGGTYYVAYDDTTSVQLVNYDRNGDVVKAVTVQAGEYRQPQLVAAQGRFYVVTEDAGGRGYVTVFDANLDKIDGSMIGGGLGRIMKYPMLAVDGSTWVVAYQDGQGGSVKLQRLVPMP